MGYRHVRGDAVMNTEHVYRQQSEESRARIDQATAQLRAAYAARVRQERRMMLAIGSLLAVTAAIAALLVWP